MGLSWTDADSKFDRSIGPVDSDDTHYLGVEPTGNGNQEILYARFRVKYGDSLPYGGDLTLTKEQAAWLHQILESVNKRMEDLERTERKYFTLKKQLANE